MSERKWKVGRDLFGGRHVYDEGGDRLTNDRMNGTEGWEESAALIASAPDLLEALDTLVAIVGLTAFKYEGQRAVLQQAYDQAVAAIARAQGKG